MKIVFFSTYYAPYLKSFLERNVDFAALNYEEQKNRLKADYYPVWGSYETYTRRLGFDSELIVANLEPMQKQWAKEKGVKYDESTWMFSIAISQIKMMKPDIFFIGSLFNFYGQFLEEIRPFCRKIFGWIACPIPSQVNLNQISLLLSSTTEYVENFRRQGINSEVLNAAFDTDILKVLPTIPESTKQIPVTFIGGLTEAHSERVKTLQLVSRRTPMKIWGTGLARSKFGVFNFLNRNSIKRNFQGEVFGKDMFAILQKSKITFNAHIAESGKYAGNMRMYEATGMGSLLVSDYKKNASEIFVEDKEAIFYRSANEAVEKINYYLENDELRKRIAEAGQKRTISQYNFADNVSLMVDYFKRYL